MAMCVGDEFFRLYYRLFQMRFYSSLKAMWIGSWVLNIIFFNYKKQYAG